MPDGMLAMGLPLVVGRAIEEIAPSLDVSMPGGIAGQPISRVLTLGLGLGTVAYVANEIAIKKRSLTPTTMSAFLVGGTLLSGEIIKMVSGVMPAPAGARVVVRPTPVAARAAVPARVAKPKLY